MQYHEVSVYEEVLPEDHPFGGTSIYTWRCSCGAKSRREFVTSREASEIAGEKHAAKMRSRPNVRRRKG